MDAVVLEGAYFDGASSRRHTARMEVAGGIARVLRGADGPDGEAGQGGGEPFAQAAFDRLAVSSRVGNTPRFLAFPGGGRFETRDNDAVDRLVAAHRPSRGAGLAHRLESRLRYVLLGLVVTIAFVWSGIQWGIPAAAKAVAFSLPVEVNNHADRSVLEVLDRIWLEPSKLPEARQEALHAAFAPFVAAAGDSPRIRVLFRDAEGTIGANALALPAGTVVITDQLVGLAEHDEEIIAVLAHEIGHAVHRHVMRRTLQASAVGLVSMVVLGDVSSVSSAIAAIPVMLTELGYSRAFEREADRYAVDMLRAHGIAPRRLADMLERLDPDKDERHAYLSTHPPTPERVRLILSH